MPVAASGVEPSRDARPQHAPVQHAGAKLVAPDTHPVGEFLGRIETAIFVTENEMVCPRDADDIHGRFMGSTASRGSRSSEGPVPWVQKVRSMLVCSNHV